jgi:hypothetical protein
VTQRLRSKKRKENQKNNWGLFHLYVLVSAALIIAMWGVIIRGGEPPPARTLHVVERPTVCLFLVDGAIRRYTHYQGGGYPAKLSELLPRYFPIPKEKLSCLDTLSYSTDPRGGYRLTLTDRSTGDVIIMLSPQGVINRSPSVRES